MTGDSVRVKEGGVADAMRLMMAMRLEARWSQRRPIGSAAHGAHIKASRLIFHTDVRMSRHVNKSRQLICVTRLSLTRVAAAPRRSGRSEGGAS